ASRADDVTTGKTSVRIRIRRQDREQALEARLCVVATGYGSSLVRQLGFKDHSRLIQGAQTIMEGNYGSPARIFLGSKLAPKGFGWSVPVGGGRSRIGVVSFRRAPFYLRRILNRFLEEEGGSGEALPRIQVSPIPFGALESTVMDRVMVIGEAAGQVKTTTQGGIYYGLLSAEAAAETTVEAFRNGNLSREALRPYENRWRSRLEKELEMGTIFREFFSELSDRQLDRLFDIARIDGVLPLIQKKARFDWHAPIIQSFLTNGFLGSIVRSALGLCPLKTRVL
ncbi:MAG TPA: NAD(P)/FAD-dependent oxidoreductase, partial [Nitrospiria bacterium]